MKKVLVLENEFVRKEDAVSSVIEMFKEKGCEITIIEQAHIKDKAVLLNAITSADTLLFQTTWLRTDELSMFGQLLAIANPLEIYAISLCSKSLEDNIEYTFGVEVLAQLTKHKLFDVKRWHHDEDWVREVNLNAYKEQVEEKKRKEQELYKGLSTTGYKIKIKKIQATGSQFSNLKEGDIVEELDYSAHDKDTNRGIWVMGNGEPVKLLNSDGYDEFEFAENKCFALARDFYARGNRLNKKDGITLLAQFINGYLQKSINDGERSQWDFADEVCTMVGVERRGNRSYIDTRLTAYLKQYQYFTELDRTHKCFLTKKFA